jgi:hypothetical protein
MNRPPYSIDLAGVFVTSGGRTLSSIRDPDLLTEWRFRPAANQVKPIRKTLPSFQPLEL